MTTSLTHFLSPLTKPRVTPPSLLPLPVPTTATWSPQQTPRGDARLAFSLLLQTKWGPPGWARGTQPLSAESSPQGHSGHRAEPSHRTRRSCLISGDHPNRTEATDEAKDIPKSVFYFHFTAYPLLEDIARNSSIPQADLPDTVALTQVLPLEERCENFLQKR